MGISILITSGKGGTGKTSLTGGLASCLAALGRQVLCIDLDIGLRNLDLNLGMDDRAMMDFTDVIDHRCSLRDGPAQHPKIPGLFLLTAPVSLRDAPDPRKFRAMVRDARRLYDYVLMDSPAGLGSGFQLALSAADRAIVVSNTDPASLRDAQRTVSELQGKISPIHLVVNRVQPRLMRRMHTTIDQAMDTAGLPLLGVVPEDKQVLLAASMGVPLILTSRRGAAVAYLNITRRLLGQRVPLMRL